MRRLLVETCNPKAQRHGEALPMNHPHSYSCTEILPDFLSILLSEKPSIAICVHLCVRDDNSLRRINSVESLSAHERQNSALIWKEVEFSALLCGNADKSVCLPFRPPIRRNPARDLAALKPALEKPLLLLRALRVSIICGGPVITGI